MFYQLLCRDNKINNYRVELPVSICEINVNGFDNLI